MRVSINKEATVKQITKLVERYGFESHAQVLEKAVELLWQAEKNKALQELAEKQSKFYEENPEEKDFLAVIIEGPHERHP